MSAFAEYNAGLITRDELAAAVRMEQWFDDYLEEREEPDEDEAEDEE